VRKAKEIFIKLWAYKKIKWPVVIIVAFCFITGVRTIYSYPTWIFDYMWWGSEFKSAVDFGPQLQHKTAPDFTGYDLDGREVKLSDYFGKSTLLVFFSFY